LIRWGWIPTLSGDLETDFYQYSTSDLFKAKCYRNLAEDQFAVRKTTSDKTDALEIYIDYKHPKDAYSDEITFSLGEFDPKDDASSEVLYCGTARI
jgi:hypothetical protein